MMRQEQQGLQLPLSRQLLRNRGAAAMRAGAVLLICQMTGYRTPGAYRVDSVLLPVMMVTDIELFYSRCSQQQCGG